MSESAPRGPDVCPRCGAHVEPLAGEDAPGSEQRKACPDCGAELRRAVGEAWQLAG